MRNFQFLTYEIDKEGLSFTYETLEHFKNRLGEECELFFITGADCLMSIDKWREVSKILSLCTFVVFSRGGFDNEVLKEKKKKLKKNLNAILLF